MSNNSEKYCMSAFPFANLHDSEFASTMGSNSISSKLNIKDLSDKVFNPFQVNDDNQNLDIYAADPDLNYFNNATTLSNVSSCDYYNEDTFNAKCNSLNLDPKSISVLHLNIRSASKNLEKLEIYLKNISYEFKFIGLSETWFNDVSVDQYSLTHYNIESVYRSHCRGGGVSLLIKDSIQYCVRKDLCINDAILQAIFVEVDKDIFAVGVNIILGVIYRPPNTDIITFNDKLNYVLNVIQKERKTVFLMGDYNINLMNENHSPTCQFLDTLYSNSMFPLISKPTRITEINATLIDNIFCNDIEFNNYLNGLFFTDISDHLPVFSVKIMPNSNVLAKPLTSIRDLSIKNITNFKDIIGKTNWNSVYNSNDANEAFNNFSKIFSTKYKECFPIKIIRSQYRQRKQWLSTSIKHAIKHKNKLYVKAMRHPTKDNMQYYKQYKNNLNMLLKTAERQYYDKILHDNRSNLKKSWKIIKEVIKNSKNNTTSKIKIGENYTTDPSKISNGFNNFFANIGKNLASKIPRSSIDPLQYLENFNANSIALYNTNNEEVSNIVKKLKNSLVGPDEISSNVIKHTLNSVVDPLVHIFNLSITHGTFPNELKLAHVTPIYKNGDHFILNNYRPISILPVFSKILERLIYNRLVNYVTSNNILYKHQFGFRENHGTSLALIYLVDKINQALNKGDYIIGTFIDLSKAFDTIDHNILYRKLERYGIRGVALDLIKSYLHDRKQCVKFNNTLSDKATISYGVPQGSILGPLLFLLYINDLAFVSKILFLLIFADDTNLFITGKDINSMINTMNQELIKINDWMIANRLSLNVAKTQYMIICGPKKFPITDSDVYINQHKITMVNTVKFLGIIIDSKLSWSSHILYIKSKIAKSIGIICKARKKLCKNTLLTLYYSFIHPYLNYGIEIWGNTYAKYTNLLFIQQKKTLRIIKSVGPRDSTKDIFKELNILTLYQLYQHNIAVFMFKYLKGYLPEVFKGMFSYSLAQRYNLRTSNNLRLPYFRLNICQQHVRYTGVKIWNIVTSKIYHFCSIHTFRKKFKCFLIGNGTICL